MRRNDSLSILPFACGKEVIQKHMTSGDKVALCLGLAHWNLEPETPVQAIQYWQACGWLADTKEEQKLWRQWKFSIAGPFAVLAFVPQNIRNISHISCKTNHPKIMNLKFLPDHDFLSSKKDQF